MADCGNGKQHADKLIPGPLMSFLKIIITIQRMGATMGSDEAPTATTLAPPLTDPYSWFDFYDRDASNTLDQEEVISGLYNTLQIAQKNSSSASAATSATTVDAIRESIQAIWPAFDIDGNGQVSAK